MALNDNDRKYYTKEYVKAYQDTAKHFYLSATTENKDLRKKIKNMRKTVKQQSKCISRMSDKITKLSQTELDNNVLNFVDWTKYARDEYTRHEKLVSWLDDWIMPCEMVAGYDYDSDDDVIIHRQSATFPVYDMPMITANEISSFITNDIAYIVANKNRIKEYSVGRDSFILARVYHNHREYLGWIPISSALKKCIRLCWMK